MRVGLAGMAIVAHKVALTVLLVCRQGGGAAGRQVGRHAGREGRAGKAGSQAGQAGQLGRQLLPE